MIDDDPGGIHGTTPGHDVDIVENLKAVDDGQRTHKEGRRLEQRYDDAKRLLPPVGTVHLAGIVDLRWDVLQTRQKQHRVEAHTFPEIGQDDGNHGPPRLHQPAGARDTEVPQELIQQPHVLGQNPLEGNAGGNP